MGPTELLLVTCWVPAPTAYTGLFNIGAVELAGGLGAWLCVLYVSCDHTVLIIILLCYWDQGVTNLFACTHVIIHAVTTAIRATTRTPVMAAKTAVVLGINILQFNPATIAESVIVISWPLKQSRSWSSVPLHVTGLIITFSWTNGGNVIVVTVGAIYRLLILNCTTYYIIWCSIPECGSPSCLHATLAAVMFQLSVLFK